MAKKNAAEAKEPPDAKALTGAKEQRALAAIKRDLDLDDLEAQTVLNFLKKLRNTDFRHIDLRSYEQDSNQQSPS